MTAFELGTREYHEDSLDIFTKAFEATQRILDDHYSGRFRLADSLDYYKDSLRRFEDAIKVERGRIRELENEISV